MPNDAKLAMVIGVGLVVAVAILFFHKDFVANDRAPASVGNPPAASPTGSGNRTPRRGVARPTGLVTEAASSGEESRRSDDTLPGVRDQ